MRGQQQQGQQRQDHPSPPHRTPMPARLARAGGLVFGALSLGVMIATGAAFLSVSWIAVPFLLAIFGLPALWAGGMAAGARAVCGGWCGVCVGGWGGVGWGGGVWVWVWVGVGGGGSREVDGRRLGNTPADGGSCGAPGPGSGGLAGAALHQQQKWCRRGGRRCHPCLPRAHPCPPCRSCRATPPRPAGVFATIAGGALLLPSLFNLVLIGGGLWVGATVAQRLFYGEEREAGAGSAVAVAGAGGARRGCLWWPTAAGGTCCCEGGGLAAAAVFGPPAGRAGWQCRQPDRGPTPARPGRSPLTPPTHSPCASFRRRRNGGAHRRPQRNDRCGGRHCGGLEGRGVQVGAAPLLPAGFCPPRSPLP